MQNKPRVFKTNSSMPEPYGDFRSPVTNARYCNKTDCMSRYLHYAGMTTVAKYTKTGSKWSYNSWVTCKTLQHQLPQRSLANSNNSSCFDNANNIFGCLSTSNPLIATYHWYHKTTWWIHQVGRCTLSEQFLRLSYRNQGNESKKRWAV